MFSVGCRTRNAGLLVGSVRRALCVRPPGRDGVAVRVRAACCCSGLGESLFSLYVFHVCMSVFSVGQQVT